LYALVVSVVAFDGEQFEPCDALFDECGFVGAAWVEAPAQLRELVGF